LKNYKGGSGLRNVLVIGQFTASIVLAIGSIVIYQQLQYVQNKKLGYNRERIIYIPYNDVDISDKFSTIRAELLKNPQIEKISFPPYMPLNMISEGIVNNWEGKNNKENLFIYRNYVDYDFIDLFEIELLEGRNFSPEYPTDFVSSYILNESALKALGWESAIGKQFQGGRVIGVAKDFHFQPFDLAIQPLFLSFRSNANNDLNNIAIKVKMDEPEKTLAYIQQTMKTIAPHFPFEYRFMDEAYNQLYKSEKRFGQAFNIFTILALFIACIGLFALVSHHLLQRTKEIGIRKLLGATTAGIVELLSKDFLKLILISVAIASPIAWWAMNKWLQDFTYRIAISWWIFLIAGVVALLLALITVSFQAIKAAIANPVKSLRTE
jgi:putative ABC transport system permease protein